MKKKVKLDPRRLLGFRLYAGCPGAGARTGAKIGTKGGIKVGAPKR